MVFGLVEGCDLNEVPFSRRLELRVLIAHYLVDESTLVAIERLGGRRERDSAVRGVWYVKKSLPIYSGFLMPLLDTGTHVVDQEFVLLLYWHVVQGGLLLFPVYPGCPYVFFIVT